VWVSSSKVIKGPLKFRLETIILLTIRLESSFIPVFPSKAALSWIISHRHWELSASLNLPAGSVKSASLFKLKTLFILSVIVGSVKCYLEHFNVAEIIHAYCIAFTNLLAWSCIVIDSLACVEEGPSGERTYEISGIGIVDHSHSSYLISYEINHVLYVRGFTEVSAWLPDLVQFIIFTWVINHVRHIEKSV